MIIYLHGGPSSADTYVTYGFTDYLIDDYNVIAWDQRGCGRTYFHNIEDDINDDTVSFDQALADLDELVDYARNEFDAEQVIIMGHSYGTILGSEYAKMHPQKVSAYVGVAQVTSLEQTDIYSYEDVLQKAKAIGDDTFALEEAYTAFESSNNLIDMMKLRNVVSSYHPIEVSDNSTYLAVTSPYFGVDDFRWFLRQLGDLGEYFSLNHNLFDYTFEFDIYESKMDYEMPVYFISGEQDWICPVDSVIQYAKLISAPAIKYELIVGCGHNVQYNLPEKFASTVKELLENRK